MTSQGGGVGSSILSQLSYTATTDLWSGGAVTGATWTDVNTNQSFTVADANSLVEIIVRGAASATQTSGTGWSQSRIVVDSGGTSQAIKLGGGTCPVGVYMNPFGGSGSIYLSGLSAGVHTLKVQISILSAGSFFLQALSQPDRDFLSMSVIEHKRY